MKEDANEVKKREERKWRGRVLKYGVMKGTEKFTELTF